MRLNLVEISTSYLNFKYVNWKQYVWKRNVHIYMVVYIFVISHVNAALCKTLKCFFLKWGIEFWSKCYGNNIKFQSSGIFCIMQSKIYRIIYTFLIPYILTRGFIAAIFDARLTTRLNLVSRLRTSSMITD